MLKKRDAKTVFVVLFSLSIPLPRRLIVQGLQRRIVVNFFALLKLSFIALLLLYLTLVHDVDAIFHIP